MIDKRAIKKATDLAAAYNASDDWITKIISEGNRAMQNEQVFTAKQDLPAAILAILPRLDIKSAEISLIATELEGTIDTLEQKLFSTSTPRPAADRPDGNPKISHEKTLLELTETRLDEINTTLTLALRTLHIISERLLGDRDNEF